MTLNKIYKKNKYYKVGKFIHIEFDNGSVWDLMPSSLDFSGDSFDKLPEGYEFPETNYDNIFKDSKLEMIDFSKKWLPKQYIDIDDIVSIESIGDSTIIKVAVKTAYVDELGIPKDIFGRDVTRSYQTYILDFPVKCI